MGEFGCTVKGYLVDIFLFLFCSFNKYACTLFLLSLEVKVERMEKGIFYGIVIDRDDR